VTAKAHVGGRVGGKRGETEVFQEEVGNGGEFRHIAAVDRDADEGRDPGVEERLDAGIGAFETSCSAKRIMCLLIGTIKRNLQVIEVTQGSQGLCFANIDQGTIGEDGKS